MCYEEEPNENLNKLCPVKSFQWWDFMDETSDTYVELDSYYSFGADILDGKYTLYYTYQDELGNIYKTDFYMNVGEPENSNIDKFISKILRLRNIELEPEEFYEDIVHSAVIFDYREWPIIIIRINKKLHQLVWNDTILERDFFVNNTSRKSIYAFYYSLFRLYG